MIKNPEYPIPLRRETTGASQMNFCFWPEAAGSLDRARMAATDPEQTANIMLGHPASIRTIHLLGQLFVPRLGLPSDSNFLSTGQPAQRDRAENDF